MLNPQTSMMPGNVPVYRGELPSDLDLDLDEEEEEDKTGAAPANFDNDEGSKYWYRHRVSKPEEVGSRSARYQTLLSRHIVQVLMMSRLYRERCERYGRNLTAVHRQQARTSIRLDDCLTQMGRLQDTVMNLFVGELVI